MTTWRARALTAAGLAVAVNLVIGLVSDHHDPIVVTLMVVAVVAALGLLLDALGSAESALWSAGLELNTPSERDDPRMSSYRHLLERHRFSRDLDTVLQARLLALADQRIQQVYGVRLATDHDRAQILLGPDLSDLENCRPTRLTSVQIDHLIDRIEQL